MGNTAIGSWRLRSGGEHCHLELAVAAEEAEEAEERGRRTGVDIKSNNPRLTGGEQERNGIRRKKLNKLKN